MAKDKPKKTKAVALKYEPGRDEVPWVSDKGRGRAAERIIKAAIEAGIPIKADPDLVEVLMGLDLDEEIPPKLYLVVAALLAYVYAVNGRFWRRMDDGPPLDDPAR
jgi:flagellar biosynthesis protein